MTYYIKYKSHECAEVSGVCIAAKNKVDAYARAVYEAIPRKEGHLPYSAWVHSVTYNNGNYKTFNTHEGKPY